MGGRRRRRRRRDRTLICLSHSWPSAQCIVCTYCNAQQHRHTPGPACASPYQQPVPSHAHIHHYPPRPRQHDSRVKYAPAQVTAPQRAVRLREVCDAHAVVRRHLGARAAPPAVRRLRHRHGRPTAAAAATAVRRGRPVVERFQLPQVRLDPLARCGGRWRAAQGVREYRQARVIGCRGTCGAAPPARREDVRAATTAAAAVAAAAATYQRRGSRASRLARSSPPRSPC